MFIPFFRCQWTNWMHAASLCAKMCATKRRWKSWNPASGWLRKPMQFWGAASQHPAVCHPAEISWDQFTGIVWHSNIIDIIMYYVWRALKSLWTADVMCRRPQEAQYSASLFRLRLCMSLWDSHFRYDLLDLCLNGPEDKLEDLAGLHSCWA